MREKYESLPLVQKRTGKSTRSEGYFYDEKGRTGRSYAGRG